MHILDAIYRHAVKKSSLPHLQQTHALARRQDSVSLVLFSFCCALAFVTPSLSQAEHDEHIIIRIGTGSASGTYYQIGEILSAELNKALPNFTCTEAPHCAHHSNIRFLTQLSTGSTANLEDISANRLELGFAQSDVIHSTFTAEKRKGKDPSLRLIANLYQETTHLVTLKESGIKTFTDIKGHHVSIGEPGSGTLQTVQELFNVHGMNLDKSIEAHYFAPEFLSNLLVQKKIDAYFITAGFPVPGILELMETKKARIVAINSKETQSLISTSPHLSMGVIPAHSYQTETAIPTIAVAAQLIAHQKLSEELVYFITKTFWSHETQAALQKTHRVGKEISTNLLLKASSIPLHSGAARFYREHGKL